MKGSGWDRFARVYDLQLWLERPALAAAVDLLDARPGETLLDVATGTGGFLRELARRSRRPADAFGVDVSAAMLRRARRLPDGWCLLQADARSLPFPDGFFGVAACAYLLHLLDEEELHPVVAELARALAPGGRLVTVTPAARGSFLGPAYACAVRTLARRAPSAFAGLRPFDPGPALESAGFCVTAGRYVARGYPSLCLLSRRRTRCSAR